MYIQYLNTYWNIGLRNEVLFTPLRKPYGSKYKFIHKYSHYLSLQGLVEDYSLYSFINPKKLNISSHPLWLLTLSTYKDSFLNLYYIYHNKAKNNTN